MDVLSGLHDIATFEQLKDFSQASDNIPVSDFVPEDVLEPRVITLEDSLESLEPPILCLSALKRAIRLEETKEQLTGQERDISIRTLIYTYRQLDGIDVNTLTPTDANRVKLLKERCVQKTLSQTTPQVNMLIKKYKAEKGWVKEAALEGFWDAFRGYKLEDGTMFVSYATKTMDGTIKHAFRDRPQHEKAYTRREYEALQPVLGLIDKCGLSVKEACEKCGMEPAEYERLRSLVDTNRIGSLSMVRSSGEEFSYDPPSQTDVENQVLEKVILDEVSTILDQMRFTHLQEAILREMFGYYRNDSGNFVRIPGFLPDTSDTKLSVEAGTSQSYVSRLRRKIAARVGSMYSEAEEPLVEV